MESELDGLEHGRHDGPMTEQSTRQILEDVAAGRLDPSQAARLLADDAGEASATTGREAKGASASGAAAGGPAPPPAVPDIERVLVRATSRRVRIVGDPSVTIYAV